jgi:hypothetical protein
MYHEAGIVGLLYQLGNLFWGKRDSEGFGESRFISREVIVEFFSLLEAAIGQWDVENAEIWTANGKNAV